jgi:hypothetical protein
MRLGGERCGAHERRGDWRRRETVVVAGNRARRERSWSSWSSARRGAAGLASPSTPHVTRRSLWPKTSPGRQAPPRDRPAASDTLRPMRPGAPTLPPKLVLPAREGYFSGSAVIPKLHVMSNFALSSAEQHPSLIQ